jgi:hypothetical protein
VKKEKYVSYPKVIPQESQKTVLGSGRVFSYFGCSVALCGNVFLIRPAKVTRNKINKKGRNP